MSSRNIYLSASERSRASVLYRSMVSAEKKLKQGEQNLVLLRQEIEQLIRSAEVSGIDYVTFVDPETFGEIDTMNGPATLVVMAVRFGTTRLIDNMLIHR
jgi:pantoate--beta-alanine ligase